MILSGGGFFSRCGCREVRASLFAAAAAGGGGSGPEDAADVPKDVPRGCPVVGNCTVDADDCELLGTRETGLSSVAAGTSPDDAVAVVVVVAGFITFVVVSR